MGSYGVLRLDLEPLEPVRFSEQQKALDYASETTSRTGQVTIVLRNLPERAAKWAEVSHILIDIRTGIPVEEWKSYAVASFVQAAEPAYIELRSIGAPLAGSWVAQYTPSHYNVVRRVIQRAAAFVALGKAVEDTLGPETRRSTRRRAETVLHSLSMDGSDAADEPPAGRAAKRARA